ncbi:hypothetical protein QA584_07910 [Anaerocolumna sp. AGMB13025]|uniref:hypothetical protein n=1 Tax=Anaerocolumna sp. AGMB13025 TaxID=3039116 RepID=UPI00241E47B7|nr:hypothetical protein [Anaerocolumna sp. AGMB13025]WFR58994.1 hypothetical protein QA584_07910 [Anaerocolumna sp. AGMB13025]
MKQIPLSKRAAVILVISMLLLILSACSQNPDNSSTPDGPVPTSDVPSSENTSEKPSQTSSDTNTNNQTNSEDSIAISYTMNLYTKAPNENSSIKIQYPSFSDHNLEALNTLVYDKVKSFAQIDTSFFPSESGLTIDYQSAVTLLNSKIASIIFWGSSYMEGSAYPVNNLITLNVDLQTMKEITLKDLYTTNADFEKVFFEKAFFPADPITSYDKDTFADMLKLQSPEYQTVDPFSIPDNVTFFLKPDGIVLSLPAVHATGSDHLEAQLKYSDIQQFYLPSQKYWETE